MKKIELELSAISHTGDKDYEYHINTILGVLRELVNAHNELLDTHTVKEEGEMIRCEHGLIAGDECDCGKGYQKEEPTTPEKKCCDDCKKYELGVNCQCVCHGVLPRHQGESETWYKIECRNCGSGKELYYFVEFKPIPYNRINTETRSTEKRCPSCLSLDVEATKI